MATLILEHSDITGIDRFAPVLRDQGHKLDIRRLHAGDPLPATLDAHDAVVICPGEADPDGEGAPDWIEAELDLIRAAHESDRAVVGICLGSQLVARALGGTVGKLEGGAEFGWGEVELTPDGRDDAVYAGAPWTGVQLHAHRWHVTEAPPETTVLAKTDRTPMQAWRVGMRTYGFQYHPEAHEGRVGQWADHDPGLLSEAGITREALVAGTGEHWAQAARLGDRVFERLALLVMPIDRRFAGIAKDLHH